MPLVGIAATVSARNSALANGETPMAPSIFAIALALIGYFAVPVQADDATDLRGTWLGTYRVVSPTNAFGTGPRFDESEWKLAHSPIKDSG